MSTHYSVLPFSSTRVTDERWNTFVESANGGTIFHRLDFLTYHGDRFWGNEQHLVIMKGAELFGVMPMAVFEENGQLIAKSPYGASYGGPVFAKRLTYSESTVIVSELLNMLKEMGITELSITLPISPAYSDYCETFLLCLYEHGFQLTNRDISSVVSPADSKKETEMNFSTRARRMLRKAEKLGVKIARNVNLDIFWPVLLKTFAKHGGTPTHSHDDLSLLVATLPDRIYFDAAMHEQKAISGIAYFVINKRMNSSFYLANDPEYQELQGLSLLVSEALAHASGKFKHFDFGTSSVGMKARSNIFQFKESFGAAGCFRDTFQWKRHQ